MEVAIVVATFGDRRWADLAEARALPSALRQPAAEVVHVHGGDSIAEARNLAVAQTSAEWICHLDADDELEAGYLAAMAEASGDLRAPAIREVVDGTPGPARTLDTRNMDVLNPCVIGTLIRRRTLDDVGGWWPEPAWEDWSLFRRAWLSGAVIVHVPAAVYRVHVDPTGRNSTVSNPIRLSREIRRRHRQWHNARKTSTV